MRTRTAFVDDIQAAKDFATGDVVRRMGYRELLPGPFAGRVLYSNPRTGKVHVQWPWGAEEEPATELIRDTSGDVPPNMAMDQLYSTWESARHTNGEAREKEDQKWFKDLLKKDDKWRKQLASVQDVPAESLPRLVRIVARYERRTLPVWRAACKAWYDGYDEIQAFRLLSLAHADEFGYDAVRRTVSNLYEAAKSPPPHLALYWKDSGRKYKVTKREKESGNLTCPRCRSSLKPRTYRHNKTCLQCKGCGFAISPKDLVWDSGQDPLQEPVQEPTPPVVEQPEQPEQPMETTQ